MRTVFGIRSNKFGAPEERLYYQISSEMGIDKDDIYFVLDKATFSGEIPYSYNIVWMDTNESPLNSLYVPAKVGWLCGDYFYYSLKHSVIADYYWLIETDVLFGKDCKDFFYDCCMDESDFLAVNQNKKDDSWYWYESAKIISDDIYGCAFPVTRMSNQAIDACFNERKAMANHFKDHRGLRYPNDESLVATCVSKKLLSSNDIKNIFKISYSGFSTVIPLHIDAIKNSNGLFHPALEWDEYIEKVPSRLTASFKNGTIYKFLTVSFKGLSKDEIGQVLNLCSDVFNKFSSRN